MKHTAPVTAWLIPFALAGSTGLIAALASPQAAWAQQAPAAPKTYDIPAGPLEDALNQFARQAGITLSFDPAMVQGVRAQSLYGPHGVQEGLDLLLSRSALRAVRADNGNYTLRPRPPAGPVSTTATLPEVKVTGTAGRQASDDNAISPVRGYAARRSAAATKTDTPIAETPQSISVIGREEMNDRGVSNVLEALQYVPGVMTSQNGHDDRGFEWFNIRGFGSSHTANYLDGLREMGSGAYTVAQNEPYGLERIEVVRGPSSTLYGQGDAGGVINRISKRPRADAVNEAEVQLGNFGRRQIAADLGGTAGPQDQLAFRLVSLALDTKPQIDYPGFDEKHTRRTYLAPSLALNLSPDTSVVLLSDASRIRSTNNAVEYLGPDRQRTGVLGYEPSYDLFKQDQWNLGYQAEHRFNGAWKLRQNVRTSNIDMDMRAVLSEGKVPDVNGTIQRDVLRRTESVRYTALDNQLHGQFKLGDTEHDVLLGIDWTRARVTGQLYYGYETGPTLNVLDPIYGQPVDEPPLIASSQQIVQQLGFYAQHQAKLGPWRLTAGLRHDRAKTDDHNLLTDTSVTVKDSATTGRLGASYVMASGLAPYASYAESFLPTPTDYGVNAQGEPFKPTQGKQVELGVKYPSRDGQGLLTLAVFNLTKTNVITWDTLLGGRQIGEARARGLEFEAKQKLSTGLDLSAQYTYLDTQVTQSLGDDLGKRFPGTPKHMASAWMNYRLMNGDWRGLGIGVGVRYTGQRYDDGANQVETAAYTLVDTTLSYGTGPWAFALNVHNLFDKDYTGNASGYYRGSRRTAVVSARYRF